LEKIQKDLLDPLDINDESLRDRWGNCDLQAYPFLFTLYLHDIDDSLDFLDDFSFFLILLELTLLYLKEVEQIIHEVLQDCR
jgi:hypothetical protein